MSDDSDDWEAVARHVRNRMTKRKVTVAELSRKTGLSQTTIRVVRSGKRPVQTSTLMALTAGLGWPGWYLHEVLKGVENPVANPVTLSQLDKKLDELLAVAWQIRNTQLPKEA